MCPSWFCTSHPPPRSAVAVNPLRVLVVEHDQTTAENLSLLLGQSGHACQVVPDDITALDAVPTCKPDVVLLGPGHHGLVGQLPHPPAWVLAGYGRDEDRRRAREAGAEFFLVVPVDRRQLFKLLEYAAVLRRAREARDEL